LHGRETGLDGELMDIAPIDAESERIKECFGDFGTERASGKIIDRLIWDLHFFPKEIPDERKEKHGKKGLEGAKLRMCEEVAGLRSFIREDHFAFEAQLSDEA
jgi:hypothetical protein